MNLLSQKFTNPVVGTTLNGFETGDPSAFINKYLPSFIGLLFVFGGLSFFFMLLWGAVSWILSGGEKASLEAAKNKITNAFVGIILLIASFAIVKLIEMFFTVNILSIDIGPLIIQ